VHILRLAIASPLRSLFDYMPPEGLSEDQIAGLQPGIRVRIPFGRREVTGYLLAVCSHSHISPDKLKPAIEVLDQTPLINSAMLHLCQWAADYYIHPMGEVIAAAFPPKLRLGKPHQELGDPGWALSHRGMGLPEGALGRSPRQAQALALLQQAPAISSQSLAEQGISSAVMRSLLAKELVQHCLMKPAAKAPRSRPGLDLNEEQSRVVTSLYPALGSFSCHLLEGVTGSGKTEVYLQLIARCIEQNKQVLVLIPEIGLTPQTLSRFEQRFDTSIVTLHSGLTDTQRYLAWEAAREGSASIVIGTRSAIFAPLCRLGLIIVDEEHDASFKQQDGFRYAARDVAVKRGQLEGCPVLLGSATPSMESIYNATKTRYRHHQLQNRAGNARPPSIRMVDIRKQPLEAGLSTELMNAVEQTLQRNEQALLFLNRRGYAPTLQCHDCGWIAQCRHCDARLTVHRRQRKLRCHHCTASLRLPDSCPLCQGSAVTPAGLGTEQSEEALRARFGSWPIYRVDSDSMQGRNAMQTLVTQLNTGDPCIVLGTQMLTKGHHFPGISLVAVIDADAALFSSDFRGEERMVQLLTQVAGRAGRAAVVGEVIIQTHYPDHPILHSILSDSYATQAQTILGKRQAVGMPPVGFLAMFRTDAADAQMGERFLQQLRRRAEPKLPRETRLIGPLPSPMQRRAGKFRSQMMLTATSRKSAQIAARHLVGIAQTLPTPGGIKWTIDVDPQDVF
jgi:primosomal protein N' (replication factor Y) (superfamily II helicase)